MIKQLTFLWNQSLTSNPLTDIYYDTTSINNKLLFFYDFYYPSQNKGIVLSAGDN